MTVYPHHVLCNALPDVPLGGAGCLCHFCLECETLFHGLEEHECMPMFLLTPNGPKKVKETDLPKCPECGGEQTTLCQKHKMSCSTAKNKRQCVTCGDWYWPYEWHACTAKNLAKLRRLSDGPPRPRQLFPIPRRKPDSGLR